jgi:hypothetical protein
MISASPAYLAASAQSVLQPIFVITIDGYSRIFANQLTPFFDTSVVDWLVDIQDLSVTVNDLDGGSDLADLVFTVQDHDGLVTADFPGFVFEGKSIQLFCGDPSMVFSD